MDVAWIIRRLAILREIYFGKGEEHNAGRDEQSDVKKDVSNDGDIHASGEGTRDATKTG